MPARGPQRRRLRIQVKAKDGAGHKQMERWVRGRLGRVGPLRSPPSLAGEVFAELGGCSVRVPLASDAPRLRELEREFVFDHSRLYEQEAWHGDLTPSAWCSLVNVIDDEESAENAIVRIIAGRTLGHTTLQCVYAPPAPVGPGRAPPPTIVGYVHAVYCRVGGAQPDEEEDEGCNLDISHLKVDCEFQRRGVGSLLLAGLARRAEQLDWDVQTLRLVVEGKNTAARGLYRALGFKETESSQKPVSVGAGGVATWHKMRKPLKSGSLGSFSRLCETFSKRQLERQLAADD